MKKLILIAAFALAAFGANAQGIRRVRESLASPDGVSRSRVEVRESPDAARAVQAADHSARRTKIVSYRVSLFRDNSQAAGGNARAVEARFAEIFPEVPVEVSYESPYFKVTAGNFVDRTGALALCGKVLSAFPKAVVVQEETEIEKIVPR